VRIDFRDDVTVLPSLVGTRAFLIPTGMIWLGVAAALAFPQNDVARGMYQYLVLPPVAVPVMIAGVLARRASYLVGILVGLGDIVALAVLHYLLLPLVFTGTIPPVDGSLWPALILSALLFGVILGGFAGGVRHVFADRIHQANDDVAEELGVDDDADDWDEDLVDDRSRSGAAS
jgi:hypothetical protein